MKSYDLRNREGVISLVKEIKPDAIVHTAAQPSHDKAADIPFDDFDLTHEVHLVFHTGQDGHKE